MWAWAGSAAATALWRAAASALLSQAALPNPEFFYLSTVQVQYRIVFLAGANKLVNYYHVIL